MTIKYPLATSSWGDEEQNAMQDVIKSGMFTMNKKVKLFEENFASAMGSSYCVMVNSGSSANLLMIAALFYTKNSGLQLKRGDEVIVPAVSWSTTYFPLCQYGLKVKFVDIDIETLNFDIQALEAAITDKTRAILAVNLLGNPNDFDEINRIIADKNIILLEDNCESMGAEYKGSMTGSIGLMGSFSSFFSHHISTMEGGMIITDDEELFHILLSLRSHGWTRHLPKENHICGTLSDDPFEESFHFVLPGYNLRPLELSGALGIEQLKRLPFIVEQRRANGKYLQASLADHPHFMIQKEIGASSWFGFSLIIRPGSDFTRDKLRQKLTDFGIEFRPIVTGNFSKNEVMKYFDYEISNELTNADYIDQHGLFIGNQHYSIAEAIDAIKNI